jgi:hypothetical protein
VFTKAPLASSYKPVHSYSLVMVYVESSDSANCAKVQCASVSKTNRLACGCAASMPFVVNSSIDSAYTRASMATSLVIV